MVLCTEEFAEYVDKGCPAVLGGPLPHAMAAKAVAFREALKPEFKSYAQKIVENARTLAQACVDEGLEVLTGGTDNHLMLLDVSKTFGLTGRQGESAVRACGITLNRNSLPFDQNGPWYTSGLRLGTPATTTLGMGEAEMKEIARLIKLALSKTRALRTKAGGTSKSGFKTDEGTAEEVRQGVAALLGRFPLYPELDLDLLLETHPPAETAGAGEGAPAA
jgi:glycine hydroxymethyltransferase